MFCRSPDFESELSLLFAVFCLLSPVVFSLELFNTTCSIDEFLLASEEWVRSRADIDSDQRHGLAFEFTCLRRLDRRTNDKLGTG